MHDLLNNAEKVGIHYHSKASFSIICFDLDSEDESTTKSRSECLGLADCPLILRLMCSQSQAADESRKNEGF